MVVGPGLMPVSWIPCLQHTQLASNRNIVLFPLHCKQGGLKKGLCSESEVWREYRVQLGSYKRLDVGFKPVTLYCYYFSFEMEFNPYPANVENMVSF